MLESGQELSARFILVRRLGAGGSGSVWLARDRELRQFVAVKVLAMDLMQDVAAVSALQHECERARALDHPNILRVHGLYRAAQHTWIAMEYATGGDLSQLRGRGHREVLSAVIPIAAALAHAHRAGIVHRDVKPANVLLMTDGTPRLADFGVALAVASMPAGNAGRGSPYSMSSQQAQGAPALPADDIYGFGAMLYELLSGYPPFYPDSAQARRGAPPRPLPATVPPAVANLVGRLLASMPQARPPDMETVERELKEALHETFRDPAAPTMGDASSAKRDATVNDPTPLRIEPPAMRHSAGRGEPLRSEWRRSADPGASADELRRQGFRRGVGAAAIALGIAGIALVFFALPRWVGEQGQAPAAPKVVSTRPVAPAPEAKKEVDFAELARAKQQADERRAVIEERWQKLNTRAVDRWGGEESARVVQELTAGDKAYAAREYPTALQHFASIEPLLATLEKRAGEVLAAQLKVGADALSQGRSADAKAAFELALKIEPPNQAAASGLKRAATLDEVFGLLATAERLEKEGNAIGAMEHFRKALALDAQASRASDGLTRVEARVAGDAFASSMARGYSALAAADYTTARNAFEEARKLRPGAPEIAQALRQIDQEQRTRVIAAKLQKAQEHEGQERWGEALKEYRAVLELDSTVAAGNEGVARTQPRAQLNEQLELYLTQPERLFSQPVRAAARETLARAASIGNPGPVLRMQIDTLGQWLARAEVPVQVALQSDNMTQVTIYRVGTLGAFEQRSLELAPGNYTVVGTRPGYRDVRREINVTPGVAQQPVVIRCEDRI
jgi:eukaryotic-like serine/threonine-protein kinase